MLYALNANQMRSVEDRAVAAGVATIGELMERAGTALAAEVERRVPLGSVVVVCGPGNNGGDGWVAARILHDAGRDVLVLSLRRPEQRSGEAGAAESAAQTAGVRSLASEGDERAFDALSGAAAIVDAVFGFGFHGPARGAHVDVMAAMASSDAFVISADVPSGVDSDTGAVTGAAVRADVTVTFSARKPGLLVYPGASHAGEVFVADIGVPSPILEVPGALEMPSAADLRQLLPWPQPEDHKGSRGRVALVVGSLAYAGAAILAARGALRMGAGYVVAVVPDCIADVVRVSLPGALVRTVPSSDEGTLAGVDAVMDAIRDADAVVVGPGLTAVPVVAELVRELVSRVTVPLVLDADALNVLAGELSAIGARTAPTVLAPHPGEAGRLLGSSSAEVQADRIAAASALSASGATCLLKGPRSVVAGSGRSAIVCSGNAGLARAGSGDVLAGMLGTLLAQAVPAFDAAVLGAFLHGKAAEHGTQRLTETCFTAADIVDFLPDAVRELQGG